jgi:hypothetical protein
MKSGLHARDKLAFRVIIADPVRAEHFRQRRSSRMRPATVKVRRIKTRILQQRLA